MKKREGGSDAIIFKLKFKNQTHNFSAQIDSTHLPQDEPALSFSANNFPKPPYLSQGDTSSTSSHSGHCACSVSNFQPSAGALPVCPSPSLPLQTTIQPLHPARSGTSFASMWLGEISLFCLPCFLSNYHIYHQTPGLDQNVHPACQPGLLCPTDFIPTMSCSTFRPTQPECPVFCPNLLCLHLK